MIAAVRERVMAFSDHTARKIPTEEHIWPSLSIRETVKGSGRVRKAIEKKKAKPHILVGLGLLLFGARGRIRTYDSRIRNPVLYPLSYAGIWKFRNIPELH